MTLPGSSYGEDEDDLCIEILALLPRERIVYLETDFSVITREEIIVTMPNLEALYLIDELLDCGFLLPSPEGPNAHTKLLPSLQRLYLQDPRAVFGEWYHLSEYAKHQTSGNHAFSLILFGNYIHICPWLEERIKGQVEEFIYECLECPTCECRVE